MNVKERYPPDTLGYHYLMCCAVFGEEGKAAQFLAEKAERAPNGFDERVIVEESMMVSLLGAIEFGAEEADVTPIGPGVFVLKATKKPTS
jgi:hypothetical protein